MNNPKLRSSRSLSSLVMMAALSIPTQLSGAPSLLDVLGFPPEDGDPPDRVKQNKIDNLRKRYEEIREKQSVLSEEHKKWNALVDAKNFDKARKAIK